MNATVRHARRAYARVAEATQTPRTISFCGHAILGTDVFVVSDASGDKRFCENPLVVDEPSIRFYAGYPLHCPTGDRLGTLCIIDRKPRDFTQAEAETLRGLGQMVEAELFSMTLATTDELTGLSNRRGFHAVAEHALALCRRNELPATLMLLDLDGFKRINDDLGHAEGDRVLVEFARCLIKSCRESDIVARLGGDEFCAMFTGSSLASISPVRDRLIQAIAQINQERPADYPVEFSAGMVSFDRRSDQDLAALVSAADEAMYREKRSDSTPLPEVAR